MNQNVIVEICMGTTCYIMGASQFANMAERLPQEMKDRVTVKGMRCTGACQTEPPGNAPFVKINGELVRNADEALILAKIRSILSL